MQTMTQHPRTDTRDAILAAARTAVQREGYHALSFRDLAAEVGIKSASVHHHFPTKADLAEALVGRYAEDLSAILDPLVGASFDEAIDGYVALFRSFVNEANEMCLGGMMSAEVNALPPQVCTQIRNFARVNTDWLGGVLLKKHPQLSAEQLTSRATAIFAAMQGALLVTHGRGGDPAVFDDIIATYRTVGLLA